MRGMQGDGGGGGRDHQQPIECSSKERVRFSCLALSHLSGAPRHTATRHIRPDISDLPPSASSCGPAQGMTVSVHKEKERDGSCRERAAARRMGRVCEAAVQKRQDYSMAVVTGGEGVWKKGPSTALMTTSRQARCN